MSQAGLLDLLTVLATALWALTGMVCIHAAGRARQSREFLIGLGFLTGSALFGIDLMPRLGGDALPLAPMALLATAAWAMLAPMRHDLDGAERLRLCVGVTGIGLSLHAASLLWPHQPIVFGHWRAVELPVAAALTLLLLRSHRLPPSALRSHLPLLLGATAGAGILMARGEVSYDLFGMGMLSLATLPLLCQRPRTDRVVAVRAAVATAGTFVCVLASGQHDVGTRLDRLASVQGAIAQVQRSLQATQQPLDRAVANWTWQESTTAYAAAAATADAAIGNLAAMTRRLAVAGAAGPLASITAAMQQHRTFADRLLAQVQQRSTHWNDAAARSAAEADATVANREAFQALAAADAAFAELLQWQRATSAATADSAWITHRGILSLLLLLAVMAMAAFLSGPPVSAARPTVIAAEPAPMPSLFTSAAHALRAQLTTMLGNAELMVTPGADADLGSRAATIVTQGRRLATLLEEFVDLERLQQQQLSPTNQMFALDELCGGVVQQLTPTAQSHGLGIEFSLSPELPRWVNGDPVQLRRVLTTLLDRALTLTPIGSVTLQVANADGTLEFRISDGGPGLDPAACERFFDVPAPDDAVGSGRSLSLVLCHRLAAAMGGALCIAAAPGHGSELTLQLPLHPAEPWEVEIEQEDAQQTSTAETSPRANVHGRVLLVEDARDQQLTMGRLLERAGAEVTLADSGEVALHLLQHQQFDLVLMDVQMAGMDGLTATSMLRATDSQTPVVALTAATTDADREKCLAAGCNGHLGKPVDRRTLEQTLAMYLPAAVVDEVALED